MADALTILLFVAAGEGSDPTTRAMARATREALGPGAKVEVRETAGELKEDEALIAEQVARADAVVDLTWTDSTHRSATLRVHIAKNGRWLGRSIGFMPSDASTERGRTIGFTVVSMLPEVAAEPIPPADNTQPSTTPSTPTAGPPAAPPPAPLPDQDRAVHEPPQHIVPSGRQALALDLFALGAWGVDGDGGGGGGGGVAVSWFPVAPLSARLGGSLRAGSIGAVPGSTLTAALSTGIGWHPLRASQSHPLGVSLRADYLAIYQSLRPTGATVRSGNRTTAMGEQWLSGFGAVVDLSWFVIADIEALAGVGLEEVFDSTRVFYSTNVQVQMPGVAEADFPPLRVVGEAGLRVRF